MEISDIKIGVGGIEKIANDRGAEIFPKILSRISHENSETFILQISSVKFDRGGVNFECV